MSGKKKVIQIVIFLAVMLLTFYALFSGRDLGEIVRAVGRMSPVYLVPAVMLAVFFVCAEGIMIWYLLNSMREKKNRVWSILLSDFSIPALLLQLQADSRYSSII